MSGAARNAHFQPNKGVSGSKTGVSKTGGADSVVPGGKAFGATGTATATGKSGPVQVIYNGKILTPQSLQYRPVAKSDESSESKSNMNVVNMRQVKVQHPDETEVSQKQKSSHPKTDKSHHAMSMHGNKKSAEVMVVLSLSETHTVTTLALSSFIVAIDAKDLAVHDGRTSKYNAVVDAHKNADNFIASSSQTFNQPLKAQNESAAPTYQSEFGCQAAAFEINEATGYGQNVGDDLTGLDADAEDPAGLPVMVRQFVTDAVNVALITPGCLLDPTDLSRPQEKVEVKKKKKNAGTSGLGTSSVATGQGLGASGTGQQDSKVLVEASASAASASSNPNGATIAGQSSQVGGDSTAAGSSTVGSGVGGELPNMGAISHADSAAILLGRKAARILSSVSLLKRLQMMERAVQQNAFMRQQLDYRDLPDVKPLALLSKAVLTMEGMAGGFGAQRMTMTAGVGLDLGQGSVGSHDESVGEESVADSDMRGPNNEVKRLFSYLNHDLIKGRAVTCMAWNKVNQDLLAVGYGKLDTMVDPYKPGEALDEPLQGGLVLFWSLRNPEYPEKLLKTASPVTALEFSRMSPMTLAVGCLSGDVLVYDVRRESDWGKPVESSTGMQGGHSDPVWQVKWVPRGTERIETLVSVSSDGKVLQWTIKKGLLVQCLMKLVRGGQSEGWISRQAAGLCFDFCPDDPTTYIVGTEEGSLHRCSISYTEQYLETYTPHHGPVYRLKFCPHWPGLFLSCSADWSLGLYHLGAKQGLFSMRAGGEDVAIADAAWCPDNSTIFAAVTQAGKLQIWDLSQSVIDPVISIDTTGDEIPSPSKSSKSKKDEELPEPGTKGDNSLPPAAPFTFKRRGDEERDEPKEGRVTRLMKNLVAANANSAGARRVLTCVQFSERAPVIVVGDNKGTVTVYRVMSPPLITHVGPLQQTEKLKHAVMGACDPAALQRLRESEKEESEKGAASVGLVAESTEAKEQM